MKELTRTMDLTINLASQPYQRAQLILLRWQLLVSGAALMSVALLYAAITSGLSWRDTEKQVQSLEQQIAECDRVKTEAEAFLRRPDNALLRLRADLLNSMIARKAFSWTEVFTDLEHIVPAHLHVTGIQPEVNNDGQLELRLTVSGSSREAGIEVVRRLEQSSHFVQPRINSETTQTQPAKSGDRFQCSITAIYIPGFAREKAGQQRAEMSTGVISRKPAAAKEADDAGH
jgi:type IV pilus assembly protein PilN